MRAETIALALLLAMPLAVTGCPNPNTYGTPRTIPSGKNQHIIALEGIGVRAKAPRTDASGAVETGTDSEGLPLLPSYQYRRGVSDRVDLGVRVTNVSGLGADVKWNFLRGALDLAVDPGFHWVYVPVRDGFNVLYLHAPILAGVNVTDSVTLVLSPGVVCAAFASSSKDGASRSAIVTNRGVLARLGVGLNVRLGRLLAIMPEITGMRAFNDSEGIVVVGGLGFKMGAQPKADGDVPIEPPTATNPGTPAPDGSVPQSPDPQPVSP